MLDWIRELLRPFPRLFSPARRLFRGLRCCYRPWRRFRDRRLIRRFHRLYYHGLFEQHGLWQGILWLGVPTQKCPLDLAVYQEILCRTRPEVIVETGVNFGGSTLFFANICDLLGHGTVLACDITLKHVYEKVREHPRIELLEGGSTSAAIFDVIQQRCRGRRTMVILDSDHRASHVSEELRLYAPLVSPGCYLICEDTNINGHPVFPSFGPGPYEALQEFLSQHNGWTVDRDCERLLITFNPGGYLRRDED